ncbi:FeoA family protein [Amphibacillus jilinensis]|uniref:FeoA family protein n=1 Tax=Amphibacillus jilinensis TaxID=1216008 RepID=UPI000311A872|nr:FeoA family protein [Amphibacillus jilinensis]
MKLPNCQRGKNFRIINLPHDQMLSIFSIASGSIIKVLAKQPFKGPVLLQINRRKVAIGYDIAKQIIVEEVVGFGLS